ncbi:MAG: MBOAT family protein [Oscillibacter sp.]|nr:MBOAT family protein [Oscillibacter sp.]
MAFNTASFLFFLFPPLFLLYVLVPGRRGKNAFLLIASLIFYAAGQWQGLPFLLLTAVLSWGAGALIPRVRARRALLALVLALELSMLGVFKYLNFLTGIVNGLTGLSLPEADLLLPVGISFFTFKAIAYAVDVCRNEYAAARRFSDVLLYISFFPQVTSGPISRFAAFSAQLEERTPLSAAQSARGLRRFTVGFAKKTLIAGLAAPLADAAFSLGAGLDCRLAWLGAAAYTIQIYFDFSGYSDMAIGLGQMLGFHTPENFQYPYVSASITEFWRRWHISLSSWFRDYLYIPLGGGRWGTARKCLNKAVVFLLCGLWHGASWTFVLWGAWHGLLSAVESALPLRRWQRHWPVRLLGHVYRRRDCRLHPGPGADQPRGVVRPGGGRGVQHAPGFLAVAEALRQDLGRGLVVPGGGGAVRTVPAGHGGRRVPALHLLPVLRWRHGKESCVRPVHGADPAGLSGALGGDAPAPGGERRRQRDPGGPARPL